MSKITINGEIKDVALPVTVAELIKSEGVEDPEMVSVQLNGSFVAREAFGTTDVRSGDEVDFLYFMGGGEAYDFNEDELQRYSRHILLADIGIEGQERIRQGRVLIVGAGGLGSPVALYLAAAGVGTIGIVDGDDVDLTNLGRQIAHFTSDVGRAKTDSAKDKMTRVNPNVKVNTYKTFLTSSNAAELISGYDFIIDGTDNFPAKFLINDACVMAGKPFSHGGILRFEGQTFTFLPGHTCYRCVFGFPPPAGAVPTCSKAGVLGSIAGMLGTIQATEALKYLTGAGELLTDCLLTFNAKTMTFRKTRVKRNVKCPLCGEHPTVTTLEDYELPACELRKHGK